MQELVAIKSSKCCTSILSIINNKSRQDSDIPTGAFTYLERAGNQRNEMSIPE